MASAAEIGEGPDRERCLSARARAVADVLAELGVSGEVRELETSTASAAEAARALGCPLGAIAKTLVLVVDLPERVAPETLSSRQAVLAVVSGRHRVDLERLAGDLGVGLLRSAGPEEAKALTNQPIGGIAPVGHPEPLRTVVDTALAEHPVVWAAAGTPRSLFPTSFSELVRITNGEPIDVVAEG
jgi:prolyl-tRNA editing enzyme YbaK/EbsC (Cys-tRNA(Pro) deacylase)